MLLNSTFPCNFLLFLEKVSLMLECVDETLKTKCDHSNLGKLSTQQYFKSKVIDQWGILTKGCNRYLALRG